MFTLTLLTRRLSLSPSSALAFVLRQNRFAPINSSCVASQYFRNDNFCTLPHAQLFPKSPESTANGTFLIQKRFKSKKSSKFNRRGVAKEEEEDDDDDDDDDEKDSDDDLSDDDSGEIDTEVRHTTVSSLRLDVVGKTCFNLQRAKFDQALYEGLIRLNGTRPAKKSSDIRQDDVLEMIRGANVDDREKLDVDRVVLLKVDDKAASSGRYRLSFRKTNKLVRDNFPDDPWEL